MKRYLTVWIGWNAFVLFWMLCGSVAFIHVTIPFVERNARFIEAVHPWLALMLYIGEFVLCLGMVVLPIVALGLLIGLWFVNFICVFISLMNDLMAVRQAWVNRSIEKRLPPPAPSMPAPYRGGRQRLRLIRFVVPRPASWLGRVQQTILRRATRIVLHVFAVALAVLTFVFAAVLATLFCAFAFLAVPVRVFREPLLLWRGLRLLRGE